MLTVDLLVTLAFMFALTISRISVVRLKWGPLGGETAGREGSQIRGVVNMWFRPGHKSSGSTTFPGRLLYLFLPKTNLLGLSTLFLKVHNLQQQQQKKAAFKESICLSGSVQKDLGSRQICRDWMWPEQLTERKRETFLSKGSKREVGPRIADQLLLLLNFFVHSTNILVWTFSDQTLRILQGAT